MEPENVASYAAAIAAGKPVNGFKEATLVGVVIVIVFLFLLYYYSYYLLFNFYNNRQMVWQYQ